MNSSHYIGFDVHKKTIRYCVKTAAGEIVEEGSLPAQRAALRQWAAARSHPWRGAMEATLFSAWIYDTLEPYGEQLEMAHPAKMKAISAGKKKSDTLDARTIADLWRCNLLPACYVAPPRSFVGSLSGKGRLVWRPCGAGRVFPQLPRAYALG